MSLFSSSSGGDMATLVENMEGPPDDGFDDDSIGPAKSDSTKIVVVGDSAVGKTSLISVFCTGSFPESYFPTTIATFDKFVSTDSGDTISLVIVDVAGQEGYSKARDVALSASPDAKAVIFCFSLLDPSSLVSIEKTWIPLIRKTELVEKPWILVGTKLDLREDETVLEEMTEAGNIPVAMGEGKSLAERAGAKGYFECSARTEAGLEEVFDQAIRIAVGS